MATVLTAASVNWAGLFVCFVMCGWTSSCGASCDISIQMCSAIPLMYQDLMNAELINFHCDFMAI